MDHKELISRYKKQGYFDLKRKELFDLFISDQSKNEELKNLLNQLVKYKILKDPDLFGKNRGKLSALIQTELVKRHVEKNKLKNKSKNIENNNTINNIMSNKVGNDIKINNNIEKVANNNNGNSNKDYVYSEIELLDNINDLLDNFILSVEANPKIQNEIQEQLLKT